MGREVRSEKRSHERTTLLFSFPWRSSIKLGEYIGTWLSVKLAQAHLFVEICTFG